MTTNQIYNILYYLEIMWCQELKNVSPDYFKEKTQIFFNQLGKNEKLTIPYDDSKWLSDYCNTWGIKPTDYELINIIYFIMTSIFENDFYNSNGPKNFNDIISNFKKYIGDIEKISTKDLNHLLHVKLRENLYKKINENLQFTRILKLISLNK